MYDIEQSMSEVYTQLIGSLASNSFTSILSLVAYCLLAAGLYTIADRRGISKPWLAWIPFGQNWILGSISDQYQYVTMKREKSKRKVLLTLEILVTVLAVVICALCVVAIVQMTQGVIGGGITQTQINDQVMEASALLLGVLLLTFVLLGMSIAMIVVHTMALYDLFRSCDPANATLFTVLSFFLSGILQGAFVLVSRKKDDGMPPRCDQTYTQPGYLPQQPSVESWEQPQQPQDPWNP